MHLHLLHNQYQRPNGSSFTLLLLILIALLPNFTVTVAAYACTNGVKACGKVSSSVKCIEKQCIACEDGRCITLNSMLCFLFSLHCVLLLLFSFAWRTTFFLLRSALLVTIQEVKSTGIVELGSRNKNENDNTTPQTTRYKRQKTKLTSLLTIVCPRGNCECNEQTACLSM